MTAQPPTYPSSRESARCGRGLLPGPIYTVGVNMMFRPELLLRMVLLVVFLVATGKPLAA